MTTDLAASEFNAEPLLPDPLPAEPFSLFTQWFDEAKAARRQPNPNAFALATAGASGQPSVRVVLCKGLDAAAGSIVFYTNKASVKGKALAANPLAEACFFWDHQDRQARLAGPVEPLPDDQSDVYFASRPLVSQIGAWASQQSQPLASRDELMERAAAVIARFGVRLDDPAVRMPRPPHWGGFRLVAQRVELWMSGMGRLHDRAQWVRSLDTTAGQQSGGPWQATRLNP